MSDISYFHCSVTGAFAYRAKVTYLNPGQSKWLTTDNLANVSVGISKDVKLGKVSEIKDGAQVCFVMDVRAGDTLTASEIFIYKKDSVNYADYNGVGKVVWKAKIEYKGYVVTEVPSGDASGFHLKVSGLYAYDSKIQYRKPGNKKWNVTGHVANVTAGISERVNICEFPEIKNGYEFRFVMDVVAGKKDVTANEVFTYKCDCTNIASYDCDGVTLQCYIKYKGKTNLKPTEFVCNDSEQQTNLRNSSICSKSATGMPLGGYVQIANRSLFEVMKFLNNGYVDSIVLEKNGSKNRITTYANGPDGASVQGGHLWFMDKNYNCYEENVWKHKKLALEQTSDYSSGSPNITYISWNDKLLGGDPVLRDITASGKYANIFEDFDFISEKKNGKVFYHTAVDCWQKKYGYFDLYDFVFDLATNMERKKFEFTSGGKRYMFWMWKGHYLNLGAGAEMGFYEYKRTMSRKDAEKFTTGIADKYLALLLALGAAGVIALPFTTAVVHSTLKALIAESKQNEFDYYEPNKENYMPMRLTLHGKNNLPETICTYAPKEDQWWITTFVPYLQGINPKDLAPEYKVFFPKKMEQIFKDFVASQTKRVRIRVRGKNGTYTYRTLTTTNGWTFDAAAMTATYTF